MRKINAVELTEGLHDMKDIKSVDASTDELYPFEEHEDVNEKIDDGLDEIIASFDHPLRIAFDAALDQAIHGKGRRHFTLSQESFYDQPWKKITETCGVGFLTGQAVKKLMEFGQRDEVGAESELLGAIVYAAMAYLAINGYPNE